MRCELTQRAKVTEFRETQNRNRATVCERRAPPTIYDLRGHIVHGKRSDKSMNRYFLIISLWHLCDFGNKEMICIFIN